MMTPIPPRGSDPAFDDLQTAAPVYYHPGPFGPQLFQPTLPNGLGIAAMVTGLSGLVLTPTLTLFLIGGPLGMVMGPTAMVLGWIASMRVRRGLARDDGFALIGAILGAVTLAVAIAANVFVFGLWATDLGD